MPTNEDFFIVAREAGQQSPDLPTWADRHPGNIQFTVMHENPVSREDIDELPGVFILHNVLSDDECRQLIEVTLQLGYHLDAPVSLPHSVRHNTNVNWIVHPQIEATLWSRCRAYIGDTPSGQRPLGLNARFRFYRYEPGDFFKPHTDGAWPGTRVVDNELVHDSYGDRLSQLSCLLFLTDGYRGGRTLFFPDLKTEHAVPVSTPKGGALCFPHGFHPQQYLHAGEVVESGVKTIIRTDVLFTIGA